MMKVDKSELLRTITEEVYNNYYFKESSLDSHYRIQVSTKLALDKILLPILDRLQNVCDNESRMRQYYVDRLIELKAESEIQS